MLDVVLNPKEGQAPVGGLGRGPETRGGPLGDRSVAGCGLEPDGGSVRWGSNLGNFAQKFDKAV